jgi:hypothetical protein
MGSLSRLLLLVLIAGALAAIPAPAQPAGSDPGGAASTADASAQRPDLKSWRLTRHGFGRLTVGLNRAQMERRTGRKLKFSYNTGPCAIWDLGGARGISIMTTRGRLARVGIYRGTWRTILGIRIGDTEAEVRELYPELRTQPHPYDPDGQYLVVPGPNRRVVFETDGDDEVTSFRGGRMRQIMYIEGCA